MLRHLTVKIHKWLTRSLTPDSKVHGANMGPIWGRQDPGGPHVGPMNVAIWDCYSKKVAFNRNMIWINLRKFIPRRLKVRLHGRRQAARLARDMLQRDLLRGNSVYMIGSCRARLLHIIHVSAVSVVGVLQEKCSRQPVPRGMLQFKLKVRLPGQGGPPIEWFFINNSFGGLS